MKQVASIISIYAADISGVASALFELGGMTVMHDASGCNSTYNTHDEPRWYDMDSMVFISGMTEMDAVIGDDHKLINDIKEAAAELSPKFIAVAGTPIPMMTGTDFKAIARIIERDTGIPCFGINTNSMHCYFHGAGLALAAIADRFVEKPEKIKVLEKALIEESGERKLAVNIMGLTPLDFSINGTDSSIRRFLSENGMEVIGSWAMGSSLDDLKRAALAEVNLVVSSSGLQAARILYDRFGIPYVIGLPVGEICRSGVRKALSESASDGQNRTVYECGDRGSACEVQKALSKPLFDGKNQSGYEIENRDSACDVREQPLIVFIGEQIINASMAAACEAELSIRTSVISPLDTEEALLRNCDFRAEDETEIIPMLQDAVAVVADPLYRFICPENSKFISYPHEAFSGRIYRAEIPDPVKNFEIILKRIKAVI